MAKILTRLGAVLAAACCAGVAPVFAQPHGGVAAAPAPHISAPAAPHISAPAAPHFNAPAPHVAATPHVNVAPRINAAPHIAPPHFSARGPSVRQFTPRGHALTGRSFARQTQPTVHGPAFARHATRGRLAGRPVTRSTAHNFGGRNLARHATRATRGATRSANRALARTNQRTNGRTNEANRQATTGRNQTANARNNAANTRNPADNQVLNGRNRVGATNRNRVTGAEFAALSRPLGGRNRNFNDRHRFFEHRRHFGRGGFVGWFGPVFWPYAYDDLFDYAFWPYEYDDYGFWDYAYDDLLDSVLWNPGTEDIYASVGGGRYASVEQGGGAAARARRERAYRGAAQTCRQDASFAQWPIEEIAHVVRPSPDQHRLLDDLKAASDRAAKLLQSSCPAQQPSTPLGRLDAMTKRLDTMLQAVDIVRPALAKFYDSLSDEQKARFNEMGRQQSANQGGANEKNEARVCGGQGPGVLSDQTIERIESEVRPNDQQKADLHALRDASAKAANALRDACPSQTPITPVARLDAMAKRLQAMRDAIQTVRPALAKFYDSLSDEQKAHFNIMSRQQASNQ